MTVNGIRLKRRRIASSTERRPGLWLPAMNSLNCGVYSKKSWRMKRAAIVSPPVSALILASAHRRPSSVSTAVTRRAPRRAASSVGWRSFEEATKVSIGALAMVVADDAGDGVEERRLAVGADAVGEEQRVFAGRAGQAIADDPGEVGLEERVAAGDAVEEAMPLRAGATGRDRRHAGQVVFRAMLAALAGAEVDHPARRVEQPRVGVPLVGGGGEAAIGPGKW